jgi:hypothetical protein
MALEQRFTDEHQCPLTSSKRYAVEPTPGSAVGSLWVLPALATTTSNELNKPSLKARWRAPFRYSEYCPTPPPTILPTFISETYRPLSNSCNSPAAGLLHRVKTCYPVPISRSWGFRVREGIPQHEAALPKQSTPACWPGPPAPLLACHPRACPESSEGSAVGGPPCNVATRNLLLSLDIKEKTVCLFYSPSWNLCLLICKNHHFSGQTASFHTQTAPKTALQTHHVGPNVGLHVCRCRSPVPCGYSAFHFRPSQGKYFHVGECGGLA